MLRPLDATAVDHLTEVIYELLDAHEDTARLAASLAGEEAWAAHLDYLRTLQRVCRESLARVGR